MTPVNETQPPPPDPRDGRQTRRPRPPQERRGLALCLSGGGYRAVLFHTGALRRLNELGVLSSVDTFSSVSGGSIVAARLATAVDPWPTSGEPIADFDRLVADPLRALTRRNIRTLPVAARLLPWNWARSTTMVKGLEKRYRRYLTTEALSELCKEPGFVLCASDLQFGVNWVFDSVERRTGDYQAGYAALPSWPLARAVAASSCFPPVFDPLPVGLSAGELRGGMYQGRGPSEEARAKDRARLVGGIRLTDGGVYDNMGLEPVWKDHARVLVSDGGAPFEPGRDEGLLWRVKRYVSVQGRQGSAMRKRWLIRSFELDELDGTYWGVASSPGRYENGRPGYSKELARGVLAKIRTDLDRFSDAEADALQTHGYFLADAAIQKWAPELIVHDVDPTLPAPTADDEECLASSLAGSHKRALLGRGWPV